MIIGELILVDKKVGDSVFGSMINGIGVFKMEVIKDNKDIVFVKIVELVS